MYLYAALFFQLSHNSPTTPPLKPLSSAAKY